MPTDIERTVHEVPRLLEGMRLPPRQLNVTVIHDDPWSQLAIAALLGFWPEPRIVPFAVRYAVEVPRVVAQPTDILLLVPRLVRGEGGAL